MAQYNLLPIYKSAYDFLMRIMYVVNRFPKNYKFSVGEKLQNAAIDIVLDIYRANSAHDKTGYIKSLLDKVQILYLLLRVACDIKILPVNSYADIIITVDDIAKQAQGWLKNSNYLNKKINEKVPEPVNTTV